MKQHITVDQLNELTADQKDRLRKWWRPLEYDLAVVNGCVRCCYDDGEYNCFAVKSKEFGRDHGCNITGPALPLLSAGQCIQLIKYKVDDWGMTYMDTTCDWCVYLGPYESDHKRCWGADELIDGLWRVVKEVL